MFVHSGSEEIAMFTRAARKASKNRPQPCVATRHVEKRTWTRGQRECAMLSTWNTNTIHRFLQHLACLISCLHRLEIALNGISYCSSAWQKMSLQFVVLIVLFELSPSSLICQSLWAQMMKNLSYMKSWGHPDWSKSAYGVIFDAMVSFSACNQTTNPDPTNQSRKYQPVKNIITTNQSWKYQKVKISRIDFIRS